MASAFPAFLRATLGAWLAAAALGVALPATAQQPLQDPPGRIARLNAREGAVSFSPAGEDRWYDVVPNRPLTDGDRLWIDRDARAEVFVGSASVRADARTSLEFTRIDDAVVQLTLSQGSLDLRLRDDLDGERFEVDTGNLALVVTAPGTYRIDADPSTGTTRVAVAAGSATVYGENGASIPVGERQQITVSGRDLAAAEVRMPAGAAAFDRWVGERDRIEERSIAARHVSREVVGYQQLDAYGDWRTDTDYGSVWYPRNVAADWAPYRDGQWIDVAPWGWTWIDAAPWGFAPSHYGRWARVGPRWGWVPGRRDARPVFAPALVGFVGAPGPLPAGRNGVGWFPLAPGERWQPGYRASQRYVEQVNRATIRIGRTARIDGLYANQRLVEAVTIVPSERFGRGPIDRREVLRQHGDVISRAPVAFAPPLTLAATVASGAQGVPVGPALGALQARPAAAVPPPLLQPRAQIVQLAPIGPVQPRPQLSPAEGPALQQRQQQLQQIDQRREEQQQILRRQRSQQQERQDDERREAAQRERERQDLRRQQEDRVEAARDQQERERRRDDERRQAEQRQEQQRQAQRDQDRRQQAQRMERDRQEQERQTQYRQEQQRQLVQQQQRQAQQEQQQLASQLRAQEQQLQQQRQHDRQQQQQQQAARLQDLQQAQERATQQRQMQQQHQQNQQFERRQGERRDEQRQIQQMRDEQRRDEQRRQQRP